MLTSLLTCLTPPSSGDAFLLGDSIINNTNAVKEKINVSPQETSIAPNLTVKENLELIAQIYGFRKKTADLKIKDMLTTFNLEEVSKTKGKYHHNSNYSLFRGGRSAL